MSPRLKKKALVRESKPQRQLKKNPVIEPVVVSTATLIKIEDIENWNIKDQHKIVMSITKISSKIHELQLYDKVVNNAIYG